MADPFVQRILAGTQARRNVLGKVDDSDKENSLENEMSRISYHSRQKVTDLDKVNFVKSNEDLESKPLRETDTTLPPQSLSTTSLSPHKASDSTVNGSFKSLNSSRSQRFHHLAQRSKQLQEWDDDYTYHSVGGGLVKDLENSSNALHESVSASLIGLKQHDLNEMCSSKKEENISKYYFGETQNDKRNHTFINNSNYSLESSVNLKCNSATFSVSPNSAKSACNEKLNITQTIHSPTGTQNSISSSNSSTPTRRLDWDKQLLKSLIESSNYNLQRELEAQGFTPSTSKSKLAYDFRDRSPIKNDLAQNPKVKDGQNCDNPLKMEKSDGPKIVSFISKENHEDSKSDTQLSQKSDVRERDLSPSKVSDLRSRWEQHIRNASPERPVSQVKSPSPTRKFSQSNLKRTGSNVSPLRREFSPKNCQQSLPQTKGPEAPAKYGSDQRLNARSLSPHKPPPCGEIVKRDPVPEAVPVFQNPLASVKEKVAAFASISNNKILDKDPAELSVRDRLNLFEKKKGSALIPKAPFGQCVSDKALQTMSTPKPEPKSVVPEVKETKSNRNHANQNESPVACSDPKNIDMRSVVGANRRHFEALEDNWKDNDINAKILEERKSEMQVLLNRFRKPCGYPSQREAAVPKGQPEFSQVDDSDSEYPESEKSSCESDDFAPQIPPSVPLGPPKPPRSLVQEATQEFICPNPPPLSHSPSRRFNSTEIYESRNSPTKEYVPKVKPGCLFPSLSDIDSQSEAPESDEENKDSSFAESVLTCASGESLGTKIQKMAQNTNGLPLKAQLPIIEEASEMKKTMQRSLSSNTMEALDAIDDAIDEAFDDKEPTPPKRVRYTGEDDGINDVYKTPKIQNSSKKIAASENSLIHTLSMYRKQKPAEICVTPVRQITRISDFTSPSKDSPVSPSVTISSRIRELQEEEEHQLTVISQASSAISVVTQHPEQHGTMQHIEAEKLLLIATQKRQCILHEIQRLKAEGALGKRNYWSQDEDSSRGSISISNITLPLKQDYLGRLKDGTVHHFVVLVKHRDQVITSQLLTTPDCVVEGAITFPNLMALHDLTADFNISLEVYGFRLEPSNAPGFKKEHSRLKLTPLKRLQKESKSYSPSVSSPGGPYSIRSSSFALIGFANLNINTLTRNAWTLEKVPFTSPVDGHLLMRVAVTMEGGVKESSFLTMFNDVGGFGAWNRRWCVLSGPFIKFWNYPEDETTKESLGTLDLRMCTTRKVELVPRDVCARQHTFQLTLIRPLRPGDKTDLVHEIKDNAVISRILLSADSKEERILWCNKLNKSLANIRAWDPDALKPEDFHV